MSTEALNDFLQFSVQGEGEAASHSSTLTRLEEASKRTAGEVVEVSNAVVMFVYSLCEACSARGINAALCDQLVRQISHLGTRTGNPRFKEDVMKIVADAGTLVDGALAPYLQASRRRRWRHRRHSWRRSWRRRRRRSRRRRRRRQRRRRSASRTRRRTRR